MIEGSDDGSSDELQSGVKPFLREHGLAIGAGLASIIVLVCGAILILSGEDAQPPRRVQELTIVNIIPPPPPPPPPPPQQEAQPQPEPEMIDQPKMEEPEVKPEEPEAAPAEEASDEPPPGPLGLDQAAEGPGDQFNLAGKPGGQGILGGGGGGGGSRWGWYATIVTQQIESALSANPKTRNLVGQVQVRLWADGSGRVSRVQLVTSSGNPEIDAMISGQVLQGLTLRQPPPADMPMPIVTRITGRSTT